MGAPRISPEIWADFDTLCRRGYTVAAAARKVGVSLPTAYRYSKYGDSMATRKRVSGREKSASGLGVFAETVSKLSKEAERALKDFGYFQKRYLGRIATPWQVEAAESVVEWLNSPDKEYVVVNAPPGCGKSTTFSHDIPLWLIVRNRAIRILIGSKVETSARRYVRNIRREFEITVPRTAEAEERDKGLAVDAEATLAQDFGTFRPPKDELWAADAFVVLQNDGTPVDEKEPTVSAYGMDSGFLGMRYDFIVWDDLVDKLVMRTVEARERQREWWDDIAEKRLEPSGCLLLQGQRMGSDDLYRYALDKRMVVDDGEDEDETSSDGSVEGEPKYKHVIFKAHYEDRCEGNHKQSSPYYPDGCLLDPRRLTWRELRSEMANRRNNFQVIYQQQDSDPETVLVNPLWITGGTDPHTREEYPGCHDDSRGLCELPVGLSGQWLSVATADPSPTKLWSLQWWVVRIDGNGPQERYLMDHHHGKMGADELLDWVNATQTYVGVMEDWQKRSTDLHLPITHWIVEVNAAQRFMLAFEHVRRWQAKWRVAIIPHSTGINKSDPELGIEGCLPGLYKHGLVRLPRKGSAYWASTHLVEEVTHWPEYRTDDCVMAQWFLEWNLDKIMPTVSRLPRFKRPSWLEGVNTWRRTG